MNDRSSPSRGNHALWLGPLVTLVGAVSYFLIFARFPPLRDFPWVNLPLVAAGVVLTGLGLLAAYHGGAVRRRRIVAPIAFGASALVAAAFVFYVFGVSYWLPAPTERARTLGTAPGFELTDHEGGLRRLADFRGKKVVLTFYRGFW